MSIFEQAVAEALSRQPWWLRRKDTLTAAAGTILQLANIAAAYTTEAPEWLNLVIALVIGAAQIFIHAGTKGSITPSMATRLESANVEAERAAGNAARPVGLPVYDFKG